MEIRALHRSTTSREGAGGPVLGGRSVSHPLGLFKGSLRVERDPGRQPGSGEETT